MFDDGIHDRSAPLSIRVTATTYAVWIAVSGELDLSNHDQLAQAFAGLSLAGTSHVYLQLSNLSFCDVAGMRHLLAFIRRAELRGRQVSAHGASRSLRRLCHLMTDGKVKLDRLAREQTRRNSRGASPLPNSWISPARP
jgi:anti-sigma B factor antagonist